MCSLAGGSGGYWIALIGLTGLTNRIALSGLIDRIGLTCLSDWSGLTVVAAESVPGTADAQQLLDPLAGLSAVTQPVQRPLIVDAHHGRLLTRLVGADDLDETPVAGRASVRGHHPIVGCFFLPMRMRRNLTANGVPESV